MTDFPGNIDNLSATRGTAGNPLSAPNHITHHTNEDDAITALETKVGVDGSAVMTSLDFLLKNTSSIDPGHKHTNASVTLALADLSDTLLTSPANGNILMFDSTSGKWKNANATATVADASTSTKGIAKLSVAPASSSNPIAVGDNDPRFTTDSGTTLDGSANKLIDQAAVAVTATANKIARRNSNGDLAVNTTPTNSTDAASKSYVDLGDSFVAGVVTDLSTTTAGNNDISVTTTFTPRLIRIRYWIQGHTSASGTNTYNQTKGVALYNGTTLLSNDVLWNTTAGLDNSSPTPNNNSLTLFMGILTSGTTAPTVGEILGTNAGITVTLSITSVSSTGFTIRRLTALNGSNANNGRASISYEAFA